MQLEYLDTQVYPDLLSTPLQSSTPKGMRNREDRGDPGASRLYEVYSLLASKYRAPRLISLSDRDQIGKTSKLHSLYQYRGLVESRQDLQYAHKRYIQIKTHRYTRFKIGREIGQRSVGRPQAGHARGDYTSFSHGVFA